MAKPLFWNPSRKLTAEGAKRLGCSHSRSCPLLKNLPSDNKKTKKVTFQPEQASRLAALIKNPDFGHIASGDRVAYLKELLRMQRAALGISVWNGRCEKPQTIDWRSQNLRHYSVMGLKLVVFGFFPVIKIIVIRLVRIYCGLNVKIETRENA